jgi:hypothetical protein
MGKSIKFRRAVAWTVSLLLASGACALCGCELVGVAANAASGDEQVAASYTGLKGQHVGIMVWVDSAAAIDHPQLQGEVARGLQDKLQQAANAGDANVKNIVWTKADQILQFQEDHPELQTDSAQEIAPRLGVTRLIYVEVESFSLHPNQTVDLTRGSVTADVKVLEVAGDKANPSYQENDINVTYPPHAPPEGITGLSDDEVYGKSVDAFTTELAKRFITHPAEQNQ